VKTSLDINIAMNYFNALLTFLSITSLVGCASSIRKCESITHEGEPKRSIIKVESEYGPNGVTEENIQTKHFSGIQDINLTGTSLIINFINRDYIQKYSTPQKDVISRTEWGAHPTGGLIGGTVFLNFLAEPEKQRDFTFGCYEEKFLNYEYELGKRVPISSEWRNTKEKHRILVSGLDKDYEFITENTVDLRSAILNSNPTPNTTLKVSCLDCQRQEDVEQSTFNFAKSSITLSHDFKNLKQQIINTDEQRLAEERQRLEKNAEMEKLRIKSERRKLGGVPLDDFENKCLALEFKKGTKDFGDCVLKLNDMK
jgi:hypothetical protein